MEKDMEFKNKVIVVTGAGGGVGRELVRQLVEKGASVAAVDINMKALEETRERAGDLYSRVSLHLVDITDRERVSRLPGEIVDYHGRVDGLINNAGIIQPFLTLANLSGEQIDRLMNINFFGMMNMTRALLPRLAEREEACIGNVSSMDGFLPVPGQAVYGASKAAVKTATEGLRLELAPTRISVSLIIPGGIDTDIKKNSGLAEEKGREEMKKSAGVKVTSPREAARIILEGMERKKGKILVGGDAKIMDLLYRLMPLQAGKLIGKVMAQNHGGILSTSGDLMKAGA